MLSLIECALGCRSFTPHPYSLYFLYGVLRTERRWCEECNSCPSLRVLVPEQCLAKLFLPHHFPEQNLAFHYTVVLRINTPYFTTMANNTTTTTQHITTATAADGTETITTETRERQPDGSERVVSRTTTVVRQHAPANHVPGQIAAKIKGVKGKLVQKFAGGGGGLARPPDKQPYVPPVFSHPSEVVTRPPAPLNEKTLIDSIRERNQALNKSVPHDPTFIGVSPYSASQNQQQSSSLPEQQNHCLWEDEISEVSSTSGRSIRSAPATSHREQPPLDPTASHEEPIGGGAAPRRRPIDVHRPSAERTADTRTAPIEPSASDGGIYSDHPRIRPCDLPRPAGGGTSGRYDSTNSSGGDSNTKKAVVRPCDLPRPDRPRPGKDKTPEAAHYIAFTPLTSEQQQQLQAEEEQRQMRRERNKEIAMSVGKVAVGLVLPW